MICRNQHVAASLIVTCGMFVVGSSSVTGQDAVSLFNSSLEAPFLEPASSGNSAVDSSATAASLDSVDERFIALQKELDDLKKSLDATDKKSDSLKKITDKLSAPAAPVFPNTKLTGFFQADAGWFQQNANSTAQLGDLQDNRGFRRARLAAVGNVAPDVSYMLEMDFAFPGRPTFMDVWVTFAKVPLLGNVRVGQYRMPFGLDELTGVKELTFLERPVTQPMGPFRQIAVGFFDTTADQNITWAAAAFGTGTDQFGGSFGDSGYGMASRITAVAREDKQADFLVHTGLGYSFINNPTHEFEYRNNPEYVGPVSTPGVPVAVSGIPFFTDTGLIAANDANLFNGELASTWGPWHAQSEMRYNLLNQTAGGSVGFPSFYAQTGYILTGEHRPYNKPQAVLGRVRPTNAVGKGGAGAWELAARYSWVDLNQGAVQGGELHNMTYGLNWYLNDFTKFQFNYINSSLDRAAISDGQTNIYCVRCQVDF